MEKHRDLKGKQVDVEAYLKLKEVGDHIEVVDLLDNGHHQKVNELQVADERIVYLEVEIGRVQTFVLVEVDTSLLLFSFFF
jgi:hypothetical protein